MNNIKIKGGKPLKGELSVEVNKNAVLPVLCATMLSKEDCVMYNVPQSPDVQKILQAIKELGGVYTWDNKKLTVNCKNLQDKPVSDCVNDIQSAILFLGPLLARFGSVNIPVAIGCKLGRRGPEDHIEYLSHLGMEVSENSENNRMLFSVNRNNLMEDQLVQISNDILTKHIIFSETSVTPTENLLMFLSCVTKFDVKIDGIAQEPHVRFLTKILQKMGMHIIGEGSILTTRGVIDKMRGFECDFIEEPDHVDFYGHAVMVALTGGTVLLKCTVSASIRHMIEFLKKTGVYCEITKEGVLVDATQSSFSLIPGFPRATEDVYKINPKPWPGSPVDCVPSEIALHAFSGRGYKITINNWMYEDGLSYIPQLNEMGANITVFDTGFGKQKALIESVLHEHEPKSKQVNIQGVPVIEGVRAIISCALASPHEVTIKDISPILRRSPNFISKLLALGADIEIIS